MRRPHIFFATLLLCAGAANAAEWDPICADRPGKANATCTAPPDHFQVETAIADWTLDRASGDRETTLLLGSTAIKYGLTDRSHVELDVTPYVHDRSRIDGEHHGASGFGDLLVRYKQQLASDDDPVQIALYPFVKLPIAKHSVGNGKVEAGLAVPIGHAIPDSPVSITLGPELDWLADEDGHGHHAAMVQAVSLGAQLSRRFSASAELWGQWNWDPADTTRQASADGSLAYLVSESVQLDAGVNFGLNRATPDVELYAGVSKRF